MIDEENVNQAIFEKVLPQTGKTIAEEFVENTHDLSPEMKENVLKIESIPLRKGSSLQSIMNKYPAHWIDWMCKHYGLKERLKNEKVTAIATKIINDLPQIVLKLPEKSREALAFCIRQGGVVKYGWLKDYDDDRQFRVAFIPVEIREGLKSVLKGYEG